jgi:hypothetical protein
MSSRDRDSRPTEKVTVPVRRVGQTWEFLYGGDVPVKDGTLGDLTFDIEKIEDHAFRDRLTQQFTVKVLDEGAPLLVALSCPEPRRFPFTEWPDPRPLRMPAGATCFVRVHLGPPRPGVPMDETAPALDLLGSSLRGPGGLYFRRKGLDRCELQSGTVLLPHELEGPPAISLNHAYTRLSQACETNRISNTGNVYTRVFYQDTDGLWYPLNDLRQTVQAAEDRRLLGQLRQLVERQNRGDLATFSLTRAGG